MISQDEIIKEAIRQEKALMKFYNYMLEEVGPDVRPLMLSLCDQHTNNVLQLQKMLEEIEEFRNLSIAMAD